MTRTLGLGVSLLIMLGSASVVAQVPCIDGFATPPGQDPNDPADGPFACDKVDLMAFIPTGVSGPLRTGGMNDIWGWTDATTGHEYALGGTRSGVVFVDVTIPTQPKVLGKLGTQTSNSTWRDVKVYRNHAYVVSEAPGHGIQVFDLTRLRGLSADASRNFQADYVYTGIGSAHNIVLNEETGFAYAVGMVSTGSSLPGECAPKGFHAVDLSAPAVPTFAGCFSDVATETGPRNPGYTHDAQCVVYRGPDTRYSGKELCFGANEDILSIFDVTDKASVSLVSQGAYPNFSYTHQMWLTEDQRYALLNDELDEQNNLTPNQRTLVFDIADLQNPEFVFAYQSGLRTIDHNLYVRGNYAFQSNYESGLRIVDLSDIGQQTLSEAAYFDTYPQGTQTSFNGQWSNYPYFASGIVVASDINNGLFILKPDPTFFQVDSAAGPADTAEGFSLSAPTPNPTADTSTMRLSVNETQQVSATVLDVTGRVITRVFDGVVPNGSFVTLSLDGAMLPAGTYLMRVTGETFTATRQVVLNK